MFSGDYPTEKIRKAQMEVAEGYIKANRSMFEKDLDDCFFDEPVHLKRGESYYIGTDGGIYSNYYAGEKPNPLFGFGKIKRKRWSMFKKKTYIIKKSETGGKLMTLEEGLRNLSERCVALETPMEDLRAEIDKLKYPMGRIKRTLYILEYVYGNKEYDVSCSVPPNITGFRKKGDFVEIRWEEITVKINEAMVATEDSKKTIHTQLFLLKDELIPLEATVDFGDIEFEVVK